MKDKRIGFYIPALELGGAQRVTVNLVNTLADVGYQTDLVLSYRRGELLGDVSDEVRIVDLETPSVPYLGIGASIPRFVQYLNDEQLDVLFSAMTYASLVATSSSLISETDARIVGVEHNEFGMKEAPKEQFVNTAMKYGYRYVDHVVAVSDGVASSVVEQTKVDPEHVSVIYNPVYVSEIREESHETPDCSWFESPDTDVVLFVGRLARQKDLDTLVRAFELLNEDRSSTRLVIAGKGPERERLRQKVAERGLSQLVSIPGFVENPYAYMANASVFALSSLYEGLPTVLIEALACGCPIVSTDCPNGPREILVDGEYGELVPTEDPERLADALGETIADPPDSESLQRRAEDFSPSNVVVEYVDLIDELTSREARARV